MISNKKSYWIPLTWLNDFIVILRMHCQWEILPHMQRLNIQSLSHSFLGVRSLNTLAGFSASECLKASIKVSDGCCLIWGSNGKGCASKITWLSASFSCLQVAKPRPSISGWLQARDFLSSLSSSLLKWTGDNREVYFFKVNNGQCQQDRNYSVA